MGEVNPDWWKRIFDETYLMTDARSVCCVEFEATRKLSLADALAILQRYERATGFADRQRSRLSLLQILFPEVAETLRL